MVGWGGGLEICYHCGTQEIGEQKSRSVATNAARRISRGVGTPVGITDTLASQGRLQGLGITDAKPPQDQPGPQPLSAHIEHQHSDQ